MSSPDWISRHVRLLRSSLLVGVLLCAVGATQASAAAADAADIWKALDSSWNARDAARFSELFTADGSLSFVGRGPLLEGRAKIHQHFSEQFSRQSPDLRHRTTVRETLAIAPNVIAVDGDVEVGRMGSDQSAPPTVLARFAIYALLRESTDGWQIYMLRVTQLPNDDKGSSPATKE
jgi:uncharacterized protein (TIGR02246 family)